MSPRQPDPLDNDSALAAFAAGQPMAEYWLRRRQDRSSPIVKALQVAAVLTRDLYPSLDFQSACRARP